VSETTLTETRQPLEAGRDQRRWWKRPRTVTAAVAALAGFLVLYRLGTRRLRFRPPDFAPDPDLAFDPAYAWALVPQMLDALTVTALSTILGFAVAIVLGLFLALGRRSRIKPVSWAFAGLIEFVRSTPLLVQLFFLFFALPEFGIVLSPLQTLVTGLGVHYATYCSEAYRAGINSVPPGQWEAATALNLGTATTWREVVLPQAIPNVLPALGNFLVAGFKDAPLGSAFQVTGVLFFATTIAGRTFVYVEPYLVIGAGFLIVSLPAAWLVRRLENRLGYERT
jgi:polar amino acid transport system permease protein